MRRKSQIDYVMAPADQPGVELDLYGFIDDVKLEMTERPRSATAWFSLDGKPHRLELNNPESFSALTDLLAGFCWCIRITNRNVAEGNQLEFRRYRLEIGGEDGPEIETDIDSFEHFVAD